MLIVKLYCFRRVETAPSSTASETSVKEENTSEKDAGSSESVRSSSNSGGSDQQVLDEVLFGWQEKVFNASEYR